jgi:hypothetical protein
VTAAVLRRLERVEAHANALLRAAARPPDAVAFAASLGFAADPWQAAVLRSTAKRRLLLCCRQAGKSTTTAVMALHQALYTPASLILLVSPSLRQSSELFRKVTSLLRLVDPSPPLDEDNRLSLALANGSRVVSLPGSEATVRGFSGPSLIIEDEAARVSDELHNSIRPMLSVSNGSLVLLSTPNGKIGHFHDAWMDGGASWERTRITADQCPRITEAFLAEERESMPSAWYRQEYLCEFEEAEDAVFRHADIQAAFSDSVRPLFGGLSA